MTALLPPPHGARPVRWGKVLDNERCIACHACTVACKAEHLVPVGVTRTYVKQVDAGVFPTARRHFQVTRCNQCDEPPCVEACPVTAMFQRPDGIVDFDRDVCIGCKACIAACPYDAIYLNPDHHSAEKCNFCAHRIDQGLTPACVAVCPTQAIVIGDLNDPASPVSAIVARDTVAVRRPEAGTRPKVFYRRAGDLTLRPEAPAETLIQMAVTRSNGAHRAAPSHAGGVLGNAAAAILAYDTIHRAPWDWKVSAYTWTKSIAAGLLLVFALLWWSGSPPPQPWSLLAIGSAGAFLAATCILLVTHLSHPERFFLILLRPQWRSWLARGAYIITGYAILLAALFAAAGAGAAALLGLLLWPAVLLALLTAVFTGFLLGQSRGRDLWQSPLVPLRFAADALLGGAAAALLLAAVAPLPVSAHAALSWLLFGAAAAFLLLSLPEALVRHPTANGRLAAHNLMRGRYARFYWAGLLLAGVAPLLLVGPAGAPGGLSQDPAAALLALAGLLGSGHAYMQAGQSVPLS